MHSSDHHHPPLAIGIDGCRAGWLAAAITTSRGQLTLTLSISPTLADIIAPIIAAVVAEQTPQHDAHPVCAIDIPIGLPQKPGARRPCDIAARLELGPRRASVFFAPPRPALHAPTYDDVRGTGQRDGLSIQTWNILPKVREADTLLRAAAPPHQRASLQRHIIEAHPELAFARLHRAPLVASKKTAAGFAARMHLLTHEIPRIAPELTPFPDAVPLLDRFAASTPKSTWQRDDALDALVLAYVAWLHRNRIARPVTDTDAPLDDEGLPMQIWSCPPHTQQP